MNNADSRADQIRVLSGVAGHLCLALETLERSQCDWYMSDLRAMLSAIDGQIAVLKAIEAELAWPD